MIGQHILFKWPTYDWCFGKIAEWNSNHKITVSKHIVNFNVFCPDDGSSGPHYLSLDNCHSHTDSDSPNHTVAWLLLESSPPQHKDQGHLLARRTIISALLRGQQAPCSTVTTDLGLKRL